MLGDEEPLEVIVITDPAEKVSLPHNVDLLPARRNLEQFEHVFRQRSKFAVPTDTLREPLEKLKAHYDFIFLDTAPNASTQKIASYRSADWLLLSTEASKLSVDGLTDALTDVHAVREAGNADLRLLGVIMCTVDGRTRIATTYTERIKRDSSGAGEMDAFDTMITRATAVELAQAQGKTLFETEPDHKVAEQDRQLAREILKRLNTAVKAAKPAAVAAARKKGRKVANA